jgi:thioredoxin-dependent peroxiredoxin
MRYIEFLRRVLRPLEMLGKAVPDFTLASTGRSSSSGTFTLSALRGEKLVLYFYPKDNTPGCTAQAPTGDLHAQFKEEMRFPSELLADPDEAVCKQFGVMKLKTLYGKKVRGIERSTFVVDAKGVLAREWRGVKVPGHAQEVLNFVKAL